MDDLAVDKKRIILYSEYKRNECVIITRRMKNGETILDSQIGE